MSRLLRSLTDPLVYWGVPTDDGHGERTWPLPIECRGRFFPAFRYRDVRESGADSLEASELILIDATPIGVLPEPKGYIWRGFLADLIDSNRPPIDDNNETIAREIIAVHHVRGRRRYPELLTTVKIR